MWSQLGHLLRNQSMKKFTLAVELVKTLVGDEAEEKTAANDSPPTVPPDQIRK